MENILTIYHSMDKAQLEKIWDQLDGMCEALERLQEEGINTYGIVL